MLKLIGKGLLKYAPGVARYERTPTPLSPLSALTLAHINITSFCVSLSTAIISHSSLSATIECRTRPTLARFTADLQPDTRPDHRLAARFAAGFPAGS